MTDGFKERYFKRQKWTLNCEVVTPMFLGNAEQKAQWRAEPFKALLRYWWRIAQGARSNTVSNFEKLLEAESAVFGSAGAEEGEGKGKSNVSLTVSSDVPPSSSLAISPKFEFKHPETTSPIDFFSYLAGQGVITGGNLRTTFFDEKAKFELRIDSSQTIAKQLELSLSLMQVFGSVGARSRNAWGCFSVNNVGIDKEFLLQTLMSSTVDWKQSMKLDYHNSLGKDANGPLIWTTLHKRPSWQDAMNDIAQAYVELRAGKTHNGIPKLDPDNGERHLLGIFTSKSHKFIKKQPVGKNRYASPLRLIVKKTGNNYFGLFLHLPCIFNFPRDNPVIKPKDQINIWETKIHRKLDNMTDKLRRASYEDCL